LIKASHSDAVYYRQFITAALIIVVEETNENFMYVRPHVALNFHSSFLSPLLFPTDPLSFFLPFFLRFFHFPVQRPLYHCACPCVRLLNGFWWI